MASKVVIVGGVAGGMSCAARLKRVDDGHEVVVFEKGKDVSFANCGMPYYIGGVIEDRTKMVVQSAPTLGNRYDIDVRPEHEVIAINRDSKTVTVKNLRNGQESNESYDKLVLSPGAAPFRPPMEVSKGAQVFVLNDLSDMDRIHAAAHEAKSVVVVGGGFIGLELVENFQKLGMKVTLVEMLDQVMGPMDKEMTQPLLQQLELHGVEVHLSETVKEIKDQGVVLSNGQAVDSDFVCVAVGVRPTSKLAEAAGLELGPRGHIHVDAQMRTSDPDIYAVGDAVEINDWTTGDTTAIPLAGPANRQGRLAADHISGREAGYRGTQGTSIVQVFNLAAAQTGLSEKRLEAMGKDYHRVFLHPTDHAKYYPDAQILSLKLLFGPDGVIFGAQVVGAVGVKALIDTLAVAMRGNQKVQDLEHLELAYSPQWGGAKDPINMAGFVATNLLKGDVEMVEADGATDNILWLDVRDKEEIEAGMIPDAKHLPLDDLRWRTDELPKDRKIGVYCAVGLRGYIGYRFLKQQGFDVVNLNGGFRTWNQINGNGQASPSAPAQASGESASEESNPAKEPPPASDAGPVKTVKLDVCGLQCPGPIAKVKEAMAGVSAGEELEVIASDPGFASDIPSWCKATGHTLVNVKPEGKNYVARIRPGNDAAPANTAPATGDGATLVCFSNDLDKALATFIIANGAAAMGKKPTIFFTFWGLNVLRKDNAAPVKKNLVEKMFGFMMPRGPEKLKLSKMHMGGMGTAMIKKIMKDKNVQSLPELVQSALDQGVRLVACAMSMDLMGIREEELIDGVEIAGVGNYIGATSEGNLNLFV